VTSGDIDKWKKDLKEAEKLWNEAYEELASFAELHMALPFMNAINEGILMQSQSLKNASDELLKAGGSKEEVSEFLHENIRMMNGIVFYSGYLLGSKGIELEKVQCIHETGREN